MKDLTNEELRQVAYNCRKATFLIEKKQIGRITMREKLELKIHLTGCPVCRIFEKQSRMINLMIKDLFQASQQHELRLDENFKKKLQERIGQKIKE